MRFRSRRGSTAAAREGWPEPANPATFGQAVDTALSKHANYLFEAGLPLTPALEQKVQSAGAKWVLSAVAPATIKPPVLANAADCADDQLQGRLVADFMVADSGGKANAVIEHVPAYPILGCFTDAFTARVKSLCASRTTKFANITIPDLTAGRVPATLVSTLRSNPNTNYLVFDDGPFAGGVVSALKGAGLAGKVKIIGEAADATAVAALKNGTNTAWTGYDPGYLGYTMLDAALRDAEGMPVSQAEEGPTPQQILTQSNAPSGAWSEPTDALTQFKALWKVGS
jgi:ABC-type sugar transport system substrate-binding protein